MPRRSDPRSKRRPGSPAAVSVFVLGAGKAGTSLARALRARGVSARLRPARKGLLRARSTRTSSSWPWRRPRPRCRSPRSYATRASPSRRGPVALHVAARRARPGAASPRSLRRVRAGVGQMHPMISPRPRRDGAPDLSRGNMHVQGDPRAVARAQPASRGASRSTPRDGSEPRLDRLPRSGGARGQRRRGASRRGRGAPGAGRRALRAVAPKMLGPCFEACRRERRAPRASRRRSTGPVRRGDVAGLEKHPVTSSREAPGGGPSVALPGGGAGAASAGPRHRRGSPGELRRDSRVARRGYCAAVRYPVEAVVLPCSDRT